MLRVLVIGAAGRMGQALVRAAAGRTDLRIAGAVGTTGSVLLGRDVGELAGIGAIGVRLRDDLASVLAECDVALDFSHAAATAGSLAACCAAGRPLLIGTTGLSPQVRHELERAARHIALLIAPNTSLAVTLLVDLARQAAQTLPEQFDVEILEAHHRNKKDAPSGTALALGHAIAEARGRPLEEVGSSALGSREGPRKAGEIGFAVLRGGDAVGEHTVIFAGLGEQLQLTHRATDRSVFARGALDAAAWLAPRPPGRYHMRDILL
ncbi:MAG TPA: 4-hydroxy-tetrahydrodipicolinate reductase [Steroidobacteraceae bacterium]|nr:4-hydroxy-tetrahydrodipicolinate reductase [Steroidobacteraceae bacterium]